MLLLEELPKLIVTALEMDIPDTVTVPLELVMVAAAYNMRHWMNKKA